MKISALLMLTVADNIRTVQRCAHTQTHARSRLNVLFIQTCVGARAAQEVEIILLVASNLSRLTTAFLWGGKVVKWFR